MIHAMPFWYMVVGLISVVAVYIGMFKLFRSRKKSKLPYWLEEKG